MHSYGDDFDILGNRYSSSQPLTDYAYPIEMYLNQLVHELRISGMPDTDIPLFRAECRSHLEEAFEYAAPRTVVEVEILLQQFGSAGPFAKRLVAEHQVTEPTWKAFRWPAISIALLCGLFPLVLKWGDLRLFGNSIPYCMMVLVPCTLSLALAGVVKRRFFNIQYAAAYIALVFCSFWTILATSYPIQTTPFSLVSRHDALSTLQGFQLGNEELGARIRAFDEASAIFQKAKSPSDIPAKFVSGDRLVLPIAFEIGPVKNGKVITDGIEGANWDQALREWQWSYTSHPRMHKEELEQIQGFISELERAPTLSLPAQAAMDCVIALKMSAFGLAWCAFWLTLGSVTGIVGQMVMRLIRRTRYKDSRPHGWA